MRSLLQTLESSTNPVAILLSALQDPLREVAWAACELLLACPLNDEQTMQALRAYNPYLFFEKLTSDFSDKFSSGTVDDGPIRAVAITPDQQTVFSASGRYIKIHDLPHFLKHKVLNQRGLFYHVDPSVVTSLVVSPSCRALVSCTRQDGIRVWDLQADKLVHILEDAGLPKALSISTDGQLLASGGQRYSHTGEYYYPLKLWDLATAQLLKTFEEREHDVMSVALSPDNCLLASGSFCMNPNQAPVKLWNVETGALVHDLHGHQDSVLCLAFTPDGQYLVSGSKDKTLKVWNCQTGKLIHTLEGHWWDVSAVVISANGEFVLSGSQDETIKLWDLILGQELKSWKLPTSICSLSLSSDGTLLACGTGRLGENRNQTLLLGFPPVKRQESLPSISWENLLAQAMQSSSALLRQAARTLSQQSADPKIRQQGHQFRYQQFECIHTLRFPEAILAIALHPNNRTLITGSLYETIKLWDVVSGQLIRTFFDDSINTIGIQVSPDGKQVIAACRDHTVKVWDWETGNLIYSLQGHRSFVSTMAVSPDSRILITADHDRQFAAVKAWNLTTGTEIYTLPADDKPSSPAIITPDGQRLVSSSYKGYVMVWDLQTGQHLRSMKQTPRVSSLAVATDNRTIVSFGMLSQQQQPIKVWDLETGAPICQTIKQERAIYSTIITADQQAFITCGGSEFQSQYASRCIQFWNSKSGQQIHFLSGHQGNVNGLALSCDGQVLASTSADNTVKVWKML